MAQFTTLIELIEAEAEADLVQDPGRGPFVILVLVMVLVAVWLLGIEFPAISEPKGSMRSQ